MSTKDNDTILKYMDQINHPYGGKKAKLIVTEHDVLCSKVSEERLEVLIYQVYHVVRDDFGITFPTFEAYMNQLVLYISIVKYRTSPSDESIFTILFVHRQPPSLSSLFDTWKSMKPFFSLTVMTDLICTFLLLYYRYSMSYARATSLQKPMSSERALEKSYIYSLYMTTCKNLLFFLKSKKLEADKEQLGLALASCVTEMDAIQQDIDLLQSIKDSACSCRNPKCMHKNRLKAESSNFHF